VVCKRLPAAGGCGQDLTTGFGRRVKLRFASWAVVDTALACVFLDSRAFEMKTIQVLLSQGGNGRLEILGGACDWERLATVLSEAHNGRHGLKYPK
jgi:hypothetical protein